MHQAEPQVELDSIAAHIRAIRRQRAFEAAKCVLIVESNMDFVRSKAIYHGVRRMMGQANLYTLCSNNQTTQGDKSGNRVGIWMGKGNTQHKMRLALHMASVFTKPGMVALAHDFVTTTNDMMNVLSDELTRFEIVHQVNPTKNNPLTADRFEVSGKASGGKDDVVVTLMQNLYYSMVIMFEKSLCPIPGGTRVLCAAEQVMNTAPGAYARERDNLYVYYNYFH